jgi:hypothetical protein
MQTARFHWYVLISLMIHMAALWLYGFMPPLQSRPLSPIEIRLLNIPSSPPPETSNLQERSRRPTTSTEPAPSSRRTTPRTPSVKTEAAPSTGKSSSSEVETAITSEGTSSGTGVIAPGSEGIPSGSGGSSSGAAGTSSGGGRTPSGTKGTSPGTKEPSTKAAEIPAAATRAAGFQSSFGDGAIHPEVDQYTLDGINIPGTDVCREGDQIRTKERLTFARTITDHSRCRVMDLGGDSEKVICPPQADTKVVTFEGYLKSPVTYSVKVCLAYDKSNCYMQDLGDGEREVCRVNFKYEGAWAEGTIFEYKCTKSETRTYQQPLQYNIRYFSEREIDNRLRRRQVYRETRSVPSCN